MTFPDRIEQKITNVFIEGSIFESVFKQIHHSYQNSRDPWPKITAISSTQQLQAESISQPFFRISANTARAWALMSRTLPTLVRVSTMFWLSKFWSIWFSKSRYGFDYVKRICTAWNSVWNSLTESQCLQLLDPSFADSPKIWWFSTWDPKNKNLFNMVLFVWIIKKLIIVLFKTCFVAQQWFAKIVILWKVHSHGVALVHFLLQGCTLCNKLAGQQFCNYIVDSSKVNICQKHINIFGPNTQRSANVIFPLWYFLRNVVSSCSLLCLRFGFCFRSSSKQVLFKRGIYRV